MDLSSRWTALSAVVNENVRSLEYTLICVRKAEGEKKVAKLVCRLANTTRIHSGVIQGSWLGEKEAPAEVMLLQIRWRRRWLYRLRRVETNDGKTWRSTDSYCAEGNYKKGIFRFVNKKWTSAQHLQFRIFANSELSYHVKGPDQLAAFSLFLVSCRKKTFCIQIQLLLLRTYGVKALMAKMAIDSAELLEII